MSLTDFIAIYAAILSTSIFFWNIWKSKPKVRVDLVGGMDEYNGEITSGILISVTNLSPHSIHLANISLIYPYKSTKLWRKFRIIYKHPISFRYLDWIHVSLSNYNIDDQCPYELKPWGALDVFVPKAVITGDFQKYGSSEVKAVVQDKLWRNKYSKKFIFD